MIVTIDGPAGSGKSTAARGLAERLGFRFLDTGAMYRAVACACLQADVPLTDESRVARLAEHLQISFENGRVLLDGTDVTSEIRTVDVTRGASIVAVNAGVRDALARMQRDVADGRNIVTEGRDQGTFVFPDAGCKFFLTASDVVRAMRRRADLQAAGVDITLDEMLAQLRERDRRDEGRQIAPLKPADDAVVLDTSGMNQDDMLDEMERRVRTRLEKAGD